MKQTQSKNSSDTSFYHGSQNLAQALTENQIYEALFEQIQRDNPCEISVYLFQLVRDEPIWAELRANWQKNNTPSYPLHTRFYLPETPQTRLITTADPLFIDSIATDPRLTPAEQASFEPTGACSVAVLPLHAAGRDLGTLMVYFTQPCIFTLETQQMWLALINQASAGLIYQQATQKLTYQAIQIDTAAEVARAAGSILDQQELLNSSVNLIQDRFELYYVGIFLADAPKEWAVLRAGTGAAGREQIEAGHRLKIGGESMIGWAIANRQPRIALDVGKDAVHFQNPYLPRTRSEIALPLISLQEVIGAVTIQSIQQAAFSQQDIVILRIIADQLAVAIENARLFTQSKENEATTRALLEAVPDLLFRINRQGVYLEAKGSDTVGTVAPAQEFVGKNLFDILPPDVAQIRLDYIHQCLDTGQPQSFEYQLDIDGESHHFESRVVVSGSDEVLTIIRDITEQKQITQALQTSESKYRELIDTANSVIFRMTTGGIITFFNEFAQNFFGYTEDEIVGQSLLGSIIPYTDAGGANLNAMVSGLIAQPEEYATNINENIRKNGERVWLSWTNKPIKDTQGRVTEILCIGNDITALRHTQDALHQSQDRLNTILQSVQAGIITIDAETRQIVDANPAALAMIGADRQQVLGNICHQYVCPAAQGQCPVCDLGYQVDNAERTLLTANGQIVPIIKNVVQADLGGKRYLIESFVNITDQKQAEVALQDSLTRTEALFAISDTLNSLQDEQAVMEKILGEYLKLLQLNRGSIVLFNPTSGFNYVQALFINGKPAKSGLTFDATQDTVAQHLIKTPQPLVIDNVRTHPLTKENTKLVGTVNSILLIPLMVQGNITGIISADATQSGYAFTESNIALGEAIADQLSIWLQNRQLFIETQHRSTLLQTAAEVSRAASSILETNQLIKTSVNLIRDQFNFYYVGLFLVDPAGEWAVLQAGTGEAGAQQVAANHRLKVGGEGMIGWAVANRQPRIALDVGDDAVHFQNPYLPDTRSEMALPLISRGQALGALTVQSEKESAFSQEDVTLLQTMADQLANAISNARLYQASQQTARREALIKEITTKVRASANMDDILQTAVTEISQAVGGQKAYIHLMPTQPTNGENN